MATQKFTGTVISTPKIAKTNNDRLVVHVVVGFLPRVCDLNGKLPELQDNAMSSIQLSFWEEDFQKMIMEDADNLVGTMITGYCDAVTQKEQYYNGRGYVFVRAPKGAKPNAPKIDSVQVISRTSAPTAPVAPVA